MRVDAAALDERARAQPVEEELRALREDGSCRLLLGVDRLDYTKGIPRRLLTFELLLARRPEWRGRVRLIQVAVPSRAQVRAYRTIRREVDALVGGINGEFGTPHWTPVQYLYQSVPEHQLLALYRAADVMLVTPVRDGMNLVAKEFVAARSDEDGVLVLSEFAGAAAKMPHHAASDTPAAFAGQHAGAQADQDLVVKLHGSTLPRRGVARRPIAAPGPHHGVSRPGLN